MLAKLKAWAAKLSEARNTLRKAEGFNFAMKEYQEGILSIEELEWLVDESKEFGTYDYFDKGVEQAIAHLQTLEENAKN